MKTLTQLFTLVCLAALPASLRAQDASWIGFGGDGDWNNALNWDLGVPAEGTNAIIGAGNVVNYTAPMAASSFGALTLNGVLNLSAGGFVVDAAGNTAATVSGSGAALFLTSGAAMSIPNGGLSLLGNLARASLAEGATLTLSGTLGVGGATTAVFTNSSGALSAGATAINPNNASAGASCVLVIAGGVNDLGAVDIRRAVPSSQPALGADGLVISNGVVRMTSLMVNRANSFGSMLVAGGPVTNTGSFVVGNQSGANNRQSRFVQTGGLVVSEHAVGVRVGMSNSTQTAQFSVLGGTNLAERFVLGDGSNGVTGLTVNFTNAGRIYVGSGGIVSNNVNTLNVVLNPTGVFGASADWTGTVNLLLNGGAFDCADLAGAPHDITLDGVLRGSTPLTKTGGGRLTLNAANTFTGNTLVQQGTLALGPAGAIASSPQIVLAAGASLDVSAVGGYTLGASRTLAGHGTVLGDVAVAGGGILSPGTSPGTLTLEGSLTLTGEAIVHLDLPTTPGPGNDLLVVNGDLNVSGVNTLEIAGGGAPGTVHTLIRYGGVFNGATANFHVTGASGLLSNNPTTKTLSLVIQSAIRNPGDVVWVGNAMVNDWDTVNRTNWLNAGTGQLDYFVTGDNARFNALGAAHPDVNLVGNNAPASVIVDAVADYTFGGSGAISGSGNLTKTNSGKLTLNTANSYTGVTTLGGGVLEAATLAIGGVNSALGAAATDPDRLVFDGGTLRYPGGSVTTDRGATLRESGGTLDIADAGATLTVSGTLTGPGALTKTGAGNLTLTTPNSYAGGSAITQGTLQLNTAGAAGTGGITNHAATLRVNGATTVDNALAWAGACALELSGVGSGNAPLRGAWTGEGTVTVNFLKQNTSQTLSLGGEGAGGGTMWDFSGTLDLGASRGFCRLNNNASINFGSSNALFHLGSGDVTFYQRNGGTTTYLGGLSGGPNTRLSGARNDVGGNNTYIIGGKGLDTVFEGAITNGQSGTSIRPAVIVKVGAGKLTLTGPSSYTGTTTIEAGTLRVDGSLGNTAVTVTGGALEGSGIIGGSVDVWYQCTLSPGGADIGQLTINNGLSLQYGCTNRFDIDKANGRNDAVLGLSTCGYAGTLVVRNLGGTLAARDKFYLFPGATFYWGGFEAFDLPALPPPLVWDTDSLLVDGSISVTGPTLDVVNLGGWLQFSWSGSFRLQAQTNTLAVGLSGNWADYPGGESSPVIVPIDASRGAVCFRLISP